MEEVPFYPLSSFYKKKFGAKLQKIPVTLASTCPNREGINGMVTCIFCDEWGSSAYPEQAGQDLAKQIEEKISFLGHHRSAENFLVYFQTYTSTFLGVNKIREAFQTALKFPQVKGLIIGTRPDCISDATINLINEFKTQTYVAVELGVQTFSDEQLKFLKRGHTNEASLKAIKKIKVATGVDLGIHLIFGLPGESMEDMKATALVVNDLGIDHVKLHHLHVLRNTPLADMFHAGTFVPLELEEYSDRVICFLENLSPKVSIERLAALSAHWDELVAPEWTKYKLKSRQFIIDKMKGIQSFQGKALSILIGCLFIVSCASSKGIIPAAEKPSRLSCDYSKKCVKTLSEALEKSRQRWNQLGLKNYKCETSNITTAFDPPSEVEGAEVYVENAKVKKVKVFDWNNQRREIEVSSQSSDADLGGPYLTIDEVYQKCKAEILSTDLGSQDTLSLYINSNGILKSCNFHDMSDGHADYGCSLQ